MPTITPKQFNYSPDWSTSELVRMMHKNVQFMFKDELVKITEVHHYLSKSVFNKKITTIMLSNDKTVQHNNTESKAMPPPNPFKALLQEI